MDNITRNFLKEHEDLNYENMDIINDNNLEEEKQYLEYINKIHPKIKEWEYLNEYKHLNKLNKIKLINLTRHAVQRKIQRNIEIDLNEENLKYCLFSRIPCHRQNSYYLLYYDITFILSEDFKNIITVYSNKISLDEWNNNYINLEIKKKKEEKNKNQIDIMIKLIQKDNSIMTKLLDTNYMPINKKKIILECYVNKLGGKINWNNTDKPEYILKSVVPSKNKLKKIKKQLQNEIKKYHVNKNKKEQKNNNPKT